MLTKLELAVLDRIYAVCCNSFTVPFKSEDWEISLQLNHSFPSNMYNWITWIFLVSTLTFRCIILPKVIAEGNINGSIIHGILLLTTLSATVFKLNTWLFKAELVQLINQMLLHQLSLGYVIRRCRC